jgi:hypothetical protein
MCAIQTLVRTLQLYGATLSLDMLDTWDEVWKVTCPLLDTLSPQAPERAHAPIITRHHHSLQRQG